MAPNVAQALSSFPVAYGSNALNLNVVETAAGIPADAAVVSFERAEDEFSAINDVRIARYAEDSSAGAVRIVGGYFDPEMGADFSDLFLGTADALRLANARGVGSAVIQYGEGIAGHPVQHLSQLLNGIRFYLSRPATNAWLEAESSIRHLFLVLHEGAAHVWQERFQPYVEDQEKLWLFSDFLMYRNWLMQESFARDGARQLENVVAVMRGKNMEFERVIACIVDFIASEYPQMERAERRSRAESVYAGYMETGDMSSLTAFPWSRQFERELRIVLRNRPSFEPRTKAWNDVPREVLSILEALAALSIPEFTELDAEKQVEVASRMALERSFDTSLRRD